MENYLISTKQYHRVHIDQYFHLRNEQILFDFVDLNLMLYHRLLNFQK
jgi:hypothetical protein